MQRVERSEPRKWWFPLGLLLLSALGAGAVWLRLQFAIERCVESGGKWASLDRRCMFIEPEEPEPLLAQPGTSALEGR